MVYSCRISVRFCIFCHKHRPKLKKQHLISTPVKTLANASNRPYSKSVIIQKRFQIVFLFQKFSSNSNIALFYDIKYKTRTFIDSLKKYLNTNLRLNVLDGIKCRTDKCIGRGNDLREMMAWEVSYTRLWYRFVYIVLFEPWGILHTHTYTHTHTHINTLNTSRWMVNYTSPSTDP